MGNELVTVNNFSMHYGKKAALDNISLKLMAGKIIGFLGPNGSGKTTLIKILNGLLKSYDGQALVDGQPIGVHSRSLISYFLDWMHAKDALTMFKELYPDFQYDHCIALMTRFNLTPDIKIKAMSKGMKEKFQLCLVMSRQAKIYILDEPIAGVDPVAREVILDVILNNYADDALVIISTHLISDLETIFDEVVFIKEGKIIMHENTETLRVERHKSIDELFREAFKC